VGGVNGFGWPGLTAAFLVVGYAGFGRPLVSGKGFGRALLAEGVAPGPLKGGIDFVAPPMALCPPPTRPPVAFVALFVTVPTVLFARPMTPPVTLDAPPVTPPTVLFTPPTVPPTVFFAPPTAPLTWLLPGYFFAPRGVPLVVGLLLAGVELERLTTGFRAVEGRALAVGL